MECEPSEEAALRCSLCSPDSRGSELRVSSQKLNLIGRGCRIFAGGCPSPGDCVGLIIKMNLTYGGIE
jgi:hypothetical protein